MLIITLLMAAVILDNSELLAHEEWGLCNAVSVSKEDKQLGLLRLARDEDGGHKQSRLVLSE